MTAEDPYHLERFVAAQDASGTYQRAAAELRAGRKTGHWMWFIFPQIAGLGLSAMSQRYAINGQSGARAYLSHPVLGPRLRECTALAAASGRSALEIFGPVDAQKFLSCLTLFAVSSNEPVFTGALQQFFNGWYDQATMAILQMA